MNRPRRPRKRALTHKQLLNNTVLSKVYFRPWCCYVGESGEAAQPTGFLKKEGAKCEKRPSDKYGHCFILTPGSKEVKGWKIAFHPSNFNLLLSWLAALTIRK